MNAVTARNLAALGLRVKPMYPVDAAGLCTCAKGDCSGKADPHQGGKHPRWTAGASTGSDFSWWDACPGDPVGIDREASRIVTAEDDGQLREWMQAGGVKFAKTYTEISPSGGLRFFFRLPPAFAAVANHVKPDGFEVDILCRGVAPGPGVTSTSRDGLRGPYAVADPSPVADAPPEFTAWLERKFAEKAARAGDVVQAEDYHGELPQRVLQALERPDPDGDRSRKTYAVTMACFDAGLTQGETVGVLEDRCPEAVEKFGKRLPGDVASAWGKQMFTEPEWLAAGRMPDVMEAYQAPERAVQLAMRRGIPLPGYQLDTARGEVLPAGPEALYDSWTTRRELGAVKPPPDMFRFAGYGEVPGRMIGRRGKRHLFYGASGSAKTFLVAGFAVQEIRRDAVLWLDFECQDADLNDMLRAHGATPDQVAARFHYMTPEGPPVTANILAYCRAHGIRLVVMDAMRGVTDAAVPGLKSYDGQDVETLDRVLCRPLNAAGITTAIIDHTPWDSDKVYRSERKFSVSDAVFHVKNVAPIYTGAELGYSSVTVKKFRGGFYRPETTAGYLVFRAVLPGSRPPRACPERMPPKPEMSAPARCPEPGCAYRWRSGPDRPCPDHAPGPSQPLRPELRWQRNVRELLAATEDERRAVREQRARGERAAAEKRKQAAQEQNRREVAGALSVMFALPRGDGKARRGRRHVKSSA